MPSRRVAEHVGRGVVLNACSLHQLEAFGRATPGRAVAVRMNPGLGSGSTKRTNTGGPSASFGVWHDYAAQVKTVAARYGLTITKLDAGMTEVTRPSLYGAQHPIDVLATGREPAEVVFVGPCCESGDILTPAPGDPEALGPRWVPRPQAEDLVVVSGAGAYCAAMSTINYNSYPRAPEIMLEPDGTLRLLRKRQSLDQMLANEV